MCGRAVLRAPYSALRELFGLDETPDDSAPRFNIAPTQLLAVIRTPKRLELLRWGLARPESAPKINVRVESVARNPSTRRAFQKGRCLVVVDGFYEWRREAKSKSQPFLLEQPDHQPFALAGIWEASHTADGEVIESAAVLTCEARPPIAAIHDRMPLIIPPAAYAQWLDTGADVASLLAPPAVSPLVAIAVGSFVNSAANDDSRCIEPAAPPQPSLFEAKGG
jgi:putative SOS response-associated peptidase YedK